MGVGDSHTVGVLAGGVLFHWELLGLVRESLVKCPYCFSLWSDGVGVDRVMIVGLS